MAKVSNVILDKIYDTMDFALGFKFEKANDTEIYRFIKYNYGDGTVDGIAGYVVYPVGSDTTDAVPWEVTMDYSSATILAMSNTGAGHLQAALTHGKFGFIQTKGINRKAAKTGGSVTAESYMVPASTDGTLENMTDPGNEEKVCGVAKADDDASSWLQPGELMIQCE